MCGCEQEVDADGWIAKKRKSDGNKGRHHGTGTAKGDDRLRQLTIDNWELRIGNYLLHIICMITKTSEYVWSQKHQKGQRTFPVNCFHSFEL